MAVKTATEAQVWVVPRCAVPITAPAAAHMNRTLGLATVSTAAVMNARRGPIEVNDVIHPGAAAGRFRVSQRYRPQAMSPMPMAIRT